MQASRGGDRFDSLLERDAELEQIGGLLDAARDGRGATMLVEAAAGLGKSSLLEFVGDRARESDLMVVEARGTEAGGNLSFGVCQELFEAQLTGATETEKMELLQGAAGGARAIFELTGGDQPPVPDAGEQIFPILHGLLWLTSNLAENHGLLLAVDDLHWADRPSLQFLLYLSSRVSDLPVAVALACRPGEPGAPEDLLGQLRARPGVPRLSPAPLSDSGVAHLIRDRLPGADAGFCAACARATAGNPHLVAELLADIQSRGLAPDSTTAEHVSSFVPAAVLDGAETRLGRLGPDATALARAAVVLGADANLNRAATLASLDLERATDAAEALSAAAIFKQEGSLAFAHPLVRSSIESAIPDTDLAEGHGHAARLIADEETAPERVAAHLLETSGQGDPWVVRELRKAGAQALSRGVPDTAMRYLQRALKEPPEDAALASLLIDLAGAEALAARPEAIARLEQALALLDDGPERARLLLQLGRLLHAGGRVAEASESFERGLDELDGADEELALELETAYLDTAWLDSSRASEVAQRRRDLAFRRRGGRTRGDRAFLAQSAMVGVFSGESSDDLIEVAERLLAGGALLKEEGPDSFNVWVAVGCLSWSDALDSSEAATAAALAVAEASGSVTAIAQALYARSWPRYWRGRLADAAADAQAAVDAWGAAGGWGKYLPAAQYWLAAAQIDRGDLEAAEAALELHEPERWQKTSLYLMWRTAHAWLALAKGEPERARDEALAAGEQLVEVVRLQNPAMLPWRSAAAIASHRLGETDAARELAEEEVRLARRFGAPRALGKALRSAGIAEDGDAGIELLREAVGVLEDSPSRLEHCRALVELGAALRRDGDKSEAREVLRVGLDTADRFGARPLAGRAEQELRASGARPRRKALSGPDSLTPTQRRVASLVAQGLSNQEAAEALFVTRRTVETHLTSVYEKLGVDSRELLPEALEATPE
jgi:DNA-binding CsgD family transcriptional regulator